MSNNVKVLEVAGKLKEVMINLDVKRVSSVVPKLQMKIAILNLYTSVTNNNADIDEFIERVNKYCVDYVHYETELLPFYAEVITIFDDYVNECVKHEMGIKLGD